MIKLKPYGILASRSRMKISGVLTEYRYTDEKPNELYSYILSEIHDMPRTDALAFERVGSNIPDALIAQIFM